MDFRYHPIIEDLRINEDGTEIYYKGDLLTPCINDKTRKTPTYKVNFAGHSYSVLKLVCEAWNGLRENILQSASKINFSAGSHYSNLEWKEGPNTGVERYIQKLKPSDKEKILERVAKGEKNRPLAREFGINESTIRTMIKNDKKTK